MYITEDEIQEWHEIVLKQRNQFRRILRDIVCGVPIIAGMASDYRPLTVQEIEKLAKEALEK